MKKVDTHVWDDEAEGVMRLLARNGGRGPGAVFAMRVCRIAQGQDHTYVVQRRYGSLCSVLDYETWSDMTGSEFGIRLAPFSSDPKVGREYASTISSKGRCLS
jgi:hypothetical protein